MYSHTYLEVYIFICTNYRDKTNKSNIVLLPMHKPCNTDKAYFDGRLHDSTKSWQPNEHLAFVVRTTVMVTVVSSLSSYR